MKQLLLVATFGFCALESSALAGKPIFDGPVKAVERHVRDGVGNVVEKVGKGQAITIAHFGGSVTEMDGWRRLSSEWLRKKCPACKFKEMQIAAAVKNDDGGVSSDGTHSWDLRSTGWTFPSVRR